jgi:uncharacterized protein (DUF2236 family)
VLTDTGGAIMAGPVSSAARSRQRVEPVPFGPGSLLWDLAGDRRSTLVFLVPTLMQAMHGDSVWRGLLESRYGRSEG